MTKFVFWNVQHGHAAYLRTPTRHFAFDLGVGTYEGGGGDFSPLLFLKNKWGINQLDGVVISHPHRDHLDDIGNFDALSPTMLCRPRHLSDEEVRAGNRGEDSAIIEKYLEIHRRYSCPLGQGQDPFSPENNGGVTIQTFTPRSCAKSNLNNHSMVAVISYASSKLLLPGDNESASWDELLSDPAFVAAIKGTDILLAPHHGREAGYSSALFEHIAPYLCIVSDGRFCDTSATSRYSSKSRGWKVQKRGGGSEDRRCVTTRSDGVIEVEFGLNSEGKPYMMVRID